MHDTLSKTKEP